MKGYLQRRDGLPGRVDQVDRAAGVLQPERLELARGVGRAAQPSSLAAAGSLTIGLPAASKPTSTGRWPLLDGIGAPVSSPLLPGDS